MASKKQQVTTKDAIQAYKALLRAAERIGENNYKRGLAGHVKAGRVPHTYRYAPSDAHKRVIAASSAVLAGRISPEQAMAILHEHDVFEERLWKPVGA